MRVLKIPAVCILLFAFLSCAPKGPLTPELTFAMLKDAYMDNDADAFLGLISSESRNRIDQITAMMREMDAEQVKAFSEKFNITPERIKRITAKDYIALQLNIDRQPGNDMLGIILTSQIVRKKGGQKRCALQAANGMELSFVKEGAYWKLDMNDL